MINATIRNRTRYSSLRYHRFIQYRCSSNDCFWYIKWGRHGLDACFKYTYPDGSRIAFGNIDPNFRSLFIPALPGLTMLMGWNLGYGMNLIEAFQAGGAGIIVTIVFYIVSVIFIVIDRNVLGNDGSVGATFMTVAGLSVSTAGILGSIYPEVLGEYITAAASETLMAVVITSVITPSMVAKLSSRENKLSL
ncbi:2-keto-3-deoxygluconate permease [Aerococcaceae bacterium INB8]|uniref:2-keto-3-deoxygluconate permease n=1 Tax=Ruoffia halotolerans TaxID=2748684 RepID=A0A839A5T8_9LACT|nr:2-keto-3-deoxygluconate permease [Ruoffia halotolerans]